MSCTVKPWIIITACINNLVVNCEFKDQHISYEVIAKMERMFNGDVQTEIAQKACEDFQMAIAFVQKQYGVLSPITIKQVIIRLNILAQYLPNKADDDEEA